MLSHRAIASQPSEGVAPLCTLLDWVSFRLTFSVDGLWETPKHAANGLAQCGIANPADTRNVSIRAADGLELTGKMTIRPEQSGRSHCIHMILGANGMSWLREYLGVVPGRSLDGNNNHIGPCDTSWCGLQEAQFEVFQNAFDELAHRLGTVVPDDKIAETTLALASCEVCCDMPEADAIGLIQELAVRAAPGMFSKVACYFEKSRDGHLPTIRWHGGQKDGPVNRKLYAKTAGTLRAEVQCSNRRAVDRLLTGKRGSAVNAVDRPVYTLLQRVIQAASPYLEEIAGFRRSLAVPQRSVADFLLGLRPLLSVMEPANQRGRAGRRRKSETVASAAGAVRSLILVGRYAPEPNKDRTNSDRAALTKMATAADGVLRKLTSRPLLYGVSPECEDARLELAAQWVGG
ncbi:hypothetical protein [Azospirillum palustre]